MYLYQEQQRYDLPVVDIQKHPSKPAVKHTQKKQKAVEKPKSQPVSVSMSQKKNCGTIKQTNVMEFVLYILIIMMVLYILYEGMIKTQNK